MRAFASQLNPAAYKAFYVPLSTVTPLDFYMLLNLEFGGEPARRKSALFKNLQQAIQASQRSAFRSGRPRPAFTRNPREICCLAPRRH